MTADMTARFEWIKMFYPDMPKGIPVGIVHQAVPLQGGPPTWVFDHRTADSQATANSPTGLDVGTLKFLSLLAPAVTEVHCHPLGSPTMYTAPLVVFGSKQFRTSMTTTGALRTRIFLPFDQWTPMAVYPEIRPPYWAVTHLRENGDVIIRHTPR